MLIPGKQWQVSFRLKEQCDARCLASKGCLRFTISKSYADLVCDRLEGFKDTRRVRRCLKELRGIRSKLSLDTNATTWGTPSRVSKELHLAQWCDLSTESHPNLIMTLPNSVVEVESN